MAEKRDIEFLRGFVKRKKDRIVHLSIYGVADQMGGFAAQRLRRNASARWPFLPDSRPGSSPPETSDRDDRRPACSAQLL